MSVRVSELIGPAFLDVHRDIRAGGHAEYWLKGGRGSLKSSFVSIEIILGLMRNPEANAIIYRRVAATLRESVYEQIIWAIDALGVRPWFSTRLSPLEIRYKTGQRILFRGADDPSKSKSIKLAKGYFGYVWFEELSEFAGMEDVRTILASVIRGGENALVFYSYNPPATMRGEWTNAEALANRPDRLVHHSTYLQAPAAWLGKGFIAQAEALKAVNERAYRHMYLGEITGTGGQVFNNLDLREIRDEEIETLGTFYNGLDFGFAVDPDALTRWGWDARRRAITAVGEYYGQHNSADRLAEQVHAMCGTEIVRCDSAEPRMIAELQGRGVRAMPVKKGPGSVEHGLRWLQELGAITIDPRRTPNIAREFSGYEYPQDRQGGFKPEYPDKDNHTIDSTRYGLEPEIGKKILRVADKRGIGV